MGKQKDEIKCYDTAEQINACLNCKRVKCTDCVFAKKHYEAEKKRLEKKKVEKSG